LLSKKLDNGAMHNAKPCKVFATSKLFYKSAEFIVQDKNRRYRGNTLFFYFHTKY